MDSPDTEQTATSSYKERVAAMDQAQTLKAMGLTYDVCDDCGDNHLLNQCYMLRNEIWQGICQGQSFLCIACVEKRLNRKVCASDFDYEVPLNRTAGSIPRNLYEERLITEVKNLTRAELEVKIRKGLTPETPLVAMLGYLTTATNYWLAEHDPTPVDRAFVESLKPERVNDYETGSCFHIGQVMICYHNNTWVLHEAGTISSPTRGQLITAIRLRTPLQGL